MTNESEIRVLESCVGGDAAAFEPIVHKYQSLVCAITYSAVGQVEKSEELAQQVFINAWKGLGTLKDLENFKAWLVGITRNVIRDWFRRQKRDIVAKAASIDEIGDAADESSEPLEAIITKEQEAIVQQSLQQIPEKYREPMVLFYRQQQSTRQVAEALEISEDTVRTRLMRGRQMLKDQVARMVESTLSHTGPGKAFTTMVVASIAGLALTSATASAATSVTATGTTATTGVSTAGSSGFAALTTGITAKIITAAAVVAVGVGAAFAYKHLNQSDKSSEVVIVHEEKASEVASESVQEELIAAKPVDEGPVEQFAVSNDVAVEAESQLATPIEPTAPNTVQIGIHVFDDETERPIAGAQLSINRGCGCNCDPDYYETDSNGFYKIDFGTEKPSYLSILVSKDGHVPKMFAWRDEMLENLEKEFSFFLPKGKKIGGVVENVRGEPIVSAEVIVWMNDDESREFPWTRISDYTTKTDPNGRWECNVFPDEPYNFSLKLSHPDYADTKEWIREEDSETNFKDYYSLKSKLIMKDGILLSGTVVNSKGIPIQGATVFAGEDRFDDESPRATTDLQGRFQFQHFLPRLNNRIVLTIQAKGYAPELEVIPMRDKIGPVTITLGQPNTIRVRVVDVNGDPVVGAGVDVDNWRNFRSLSWKSNTDAEGRFVWNEAPADEVDIDIYKEGFLRISEQLFTARQEEYEIVMLPPLVVSGSVVDAETKEPISFFTASKGIQWGGGGIHWETGVFNSKDFKQGEYEITFDHPYPGHLVRIDAEGYLPAKSRVFDSNEATVTYNFELVKGSGPGGIVYDPNGLPAEEAEIYIVMQGYYLSFDNGKPSNEPDDDKYALTDIDGTFSFKGLLDDTPYKLVVMHDYGFTEVSKEHWLNDPNIYLQPWGRIEGTLYSGLRTVADENVNFYSLDSQNDPHDMDYHYGFDAKTDEQGRFVINRIVPGRGAVARKFVIGTNPTGRRWHYTSTEQIEVISGQTTYVNIGGGGRIVTGAIVKPEWAANGTVELSKINLNIKNANAYSVNPYEIYDELGIEFPTPERFDEMSVKEVYQWLMEWVQSEEGQVLQKRIEDEMKKRGIDQGAHHSVIVKANGEFQAVDVLPGEYMLTGELRRAREDGYADHQQAPVAEVKHYFAVDEVTEENQDIPIELGVIDFLPVAGLEIGQQLPDVGAFYNGRKTIRLSDFYGKYVLLTFYMTAADPEGKNKDFEKLVRIQNDFGNNPGFVMVGVTQGGIPILEKMAEKFLNEHRINWQNAYIDRRNYKVMQTLQIQSWPHSLLIAPDGTLIVNGLKGDELYQAVSNALANEY